MVVERARAAGATGPVPVVLLSAEEAPGVGLRVRTLVALKAGAHSAL